MGASAGVYGLCGMCLVDVVEDLIQMVLESYSSYEGKEDRMKALSCNIIRVDKKLPAPIPEIAERMLSEKPSDQQVASELDANMIKVASPKQDDEEKLLTKWSTPEVAENPRLLSKGRVAFLVSRAMMVAAFLVPDVLSYIGLGEDGDIGAAARDHA